jgi:PadR family transcriptional regulator AphA
MKPVASTDTTAHALLGLLSIEPMSGYDIRQFIPQSIGHFWSESYGQIYPTLRRLTEEGLVERNTETSASRPDRHVYTLTEAGRDRLATWLELPARRTPPRNELLLKLFFGAHAPTSISREHVQLFLEERQQALGIFLATAESLRRDDANDPNLPFWLIALNCGRHTTLASISWAKETLEELDRIDRLSRERAAPNPTPHQENPHAS